MSSAQPQPALAILGLGSNMGDSPALLHAAVQEISGWLGQVRVSSVYRSVAVLPEGAPDAWDIPFLNMAVSGITALSPQELLSRAKYVEVWLGRVSRGVWGPREIDIDILAYGDAVIDTPDLVVPHRLLLERDFALLPLAECAPDWRYPGTGAYHGRTARELVKQLNMRPHPGCEVVPVHLGGAA